MGQSKNKKLRTLLINKSIWILKSLTGILIGHLNYILNELKDDVSEDTQNDIRIIKSAVDRIDLRIFGDKIERCSSDTKSDYNEFYLSIENHIENLMK